MIQDEKINRIKDIIIETVHPEKIILFGSRANGTNRNDSDYDIFILKSGITNERTIIADVNVALFKNHIIDDIDIVVANPKKYEKHKKNDYLVYKDIHKHGITIYEVLKI